MFLGAGGLTALHSERFDFNEDILIKGIDRIHENSAMTVCIQNIGRIILF